MNGPTKLVGVDIGTTRIKAVVIDLDGTERQVAAKPTPWTVDGHNAETDPGALADMARQVIAKAVAAMKVDEPETVIAGVGVTGMAEAGVLIDNSGQPLAPIIAWHDPRGATDRVAAELPDFSRHCGMALDPVASIMKLPFLLDWAGPTARHWLAVPEWIVFDLGGDRFSEISLASRTGLYDVRALRPWPDAFAFLGAPETLLPTEPTPGVTGAGRADFDPIAGASLVVAGHDHQVAAYGEGAIGASSLFDSMGTAEALVRTTDVRPDELITDRLTASNYSIGATVVEGLWVALAGFRTGQMLERISALLGVAGRQRRRELAVEALSVDLHRELKVKGRRGVLAIEGITDDVTPAHLWRAAVEAADGHTDAALSLFDELFGPVEDVTIAGGWLNDVVVAAVKERRFGSYNAARVTEAGAVGAALMAGEATGLTDRPTSRQVQNRSSTRTLKTKGTQWPVQRRIQF